MASVRISKDKVTVPDVLIQPHSASLQMMYYTGDQFPAEYRGSAFAAAARLLEPGPRTGYKIIRAIVKDGTPTGEYEDFVTGFVINDCIGLGPAGRDSAVAKDGSLLFSRRRQRHDLARQPCGNRPGAVTPCPLTVARRPGKSAADTSQDRSVADLWVPRRNLGIAGSIDISFRWLVEADAARLALPAKHPAAHHRLMAAGGR